MFGYEQDDEEKKRQLLEQLIGSQTGDNAQAPDNAVQLPEVKVTADPSQIPDISYDQTPPEPGARSLAPQTGSLAARDETSSTRVPRGTSDGHDGGFSGMDWGTLGALLLDLGANKGRGVGQLVGAYAANKEADDREKQHHQDRLDEIATRSGDPSYKLAQLQLAEERLKLSGKHEEGVSSRAQHKFDQAESADSEAEKTKVEVAKRVAAAGAEGRILKEAELAPQQAGTKGAITTATTNATTDALRGDPKALTEAEKQAEADRQAQMELERQRLADQQENTRMVRDQRKMQYDQAERDKFTGKYGTTLEALDHARTLEALIGDKGDIPGMGPIKSSKYFPDAALSDKEIQTQHAFAEMRNPGFQERSGRAVTPGEAPRLNQEFGDLSSTNPETIRRAVKDLIGTWSNTVKGAASGREDIVRGVLESHGLASLLDGPPAAASAVAEDAPASAREALPQTRDPNDLGVTKGTAPKVLDVIGGSKNTKARDYTLKSPKSGKTGVLTLTPDELKKYEAAGWELL